MILLLWAITVAGLVGLAFMCRQHQCDLTDLAAEREAGRIADDTMKHWRTRAQSAEAALKAVRHICFPLADDEVRS